MNRSLLALLFCAAVVTGCATHDAFTKKWKLVWHDEFNQNGAPNPANWDYERGFVRNRELQWYQPENAFCTNGLLVIEARRERKLNPNFIASGTDWHTSREFAEYTSASLITKKLHEFKYGKFEIRARIDIRKGSWPAFWALGANHDTVGWLKCGEIDIMEYYRGLMHGNIAYQAGNQAFWIVGTNTISQLGGEKWANAFHVWTMEWDEDKIDLLLDGKLVSHLDVSKADNADAGNPFRQPLYLILNQAIGSTGGDPSRTVFPVRFEVDWVRVYQCDL